MARSIDARTLRRMAGARSFGRGEAYAAEGRVGEIVEHEGRLTARVAGTDTYRVELRPRRRAQAWPEWREKALALLREKAAKTSAAARRAGWGLDSPREGSELVRIFLWEKDTEGAWREAQSVGCSSDLWMALAATREQMHPADAVSVYQDRVEPTLQEKNNDAYREAVRLLRKIRLLMRRLGRQADFASYLASLRVAHKPKRNFMAMLDRATWD